MPANDIYEDLKAAIAGYNGPLGGGAWTVIYKAPDTYSGERVTLTFSIACGDSVECPLDDQIWDKFGGNLIVEMAGLKHHGRFQVPDGFGWEMLYTVDIDSASRLNAVFLIKETPDCACCHVPLPPAAGMNCRDCGTRVCLDCSEEKICINCAKLHSVLGMAVN